MPLIGPRPMRSVPDYVAPEGATTGPLASLTPLIFDIETYIDEEVTLKNMTLRQYFARSHMTALALALERDEPQLFSTPDGDLSDEAAEAIQYMHVLAQDPGFVFVAHNAAFDVRGMRIMYDMPQPVNVWCTMEGAMGAWPDLPGGYGLKNISTRMKFKKRKLDLDLVKLSRVRREIEKKGPVAWVALAPDVMEEFATVLKTGKVPIPELVTHDILDLILLLYNKRDVEATQELYYRQIALISAREQQVALMTHRVRRNHFCIKAEAIDNLSTTLTLNAEKAEEAAEEFVGDDSDIRQIFNRDETGELKSIRYARTLKLIQTKLNAPEFETASLKKASPVKLAQHPRVAKLLEQTSKASKMLFHKRRAEMFRGVDIVDVELGYARAHTFRFSSPSTGRGLNLHNVPKHEKLVAKPVRQMFRLPEGMCVVRGDLANVEYRVIGKLSGCRTIQKMFENDVNADPYCEAWYAMTGQRITKKMPIRQVSKSAVLGLSFLMSPTGYAKVLLKAIASGDVTIEMLTAISKELGWSAATRGVQNVMKALGCDPIVAVSAVHIHMAFNDAHPEFGWLGKWLVELLEKIAANTVQWELDKWRVANIAIEGMLKHSAAPDPAMLKFLIDPDNKAFLHPSVRVCCGPWDQTLCWREPYFRQIGFADRHGTDEKQLTVHKSTGMMKPFTKQLAIENVTQAAARNSLCYGLLQLEKMGYQDILHVHDEVMLMVPRNREAVLKAREDLLTVYGDNATDKPLGWAVLIKRDEVTVTQSLYEDEDDVAVVLKDKKTGVERPGGDRWGKIERNEAGCLDNLP